jgi:hypothetical protein
LSNTRHKDRIWRLPDPVKTWEEAQVAVLMDIRDELKALLAEMRSINTKLGCYRVPRALDDLHSLGVAARRRRKRRSP